MMDRNREARRAAAMANGLHRRRHRTTTNPSTSLRDSPEEEEPTELQDTARLRDRPVKKERERDRDQERDRDRDRERMSRIKRRRGDKYNSSNREDGGGGGGGGSNGGVDGSSEESVNDDEEDDEEEGQVRYIPPSNPVSVSSPPTGSTILSHRKSYPPPSKVYRVTPSWKAPDEMIGVSIPRKARSASTKRSHECWSSGGLSAEQNHRQSSPSPVRSSMAPSGMMGGTTISPSPSPAHPMSPSSSNVMMKKKIKPLNGPKNRPPKSLALKSSSVIQEEIEIEVAEVLYGLMRQSQAPPPSAKPDSLFNDSRSTVDSKSRVSSPIPNPSSTPLYQTSSSSAPLTVVAPKRKRPRPSTDEIPGGSVSRSSPISLIPKQESDQNHKPEAIYPPQMEKNEVSLAENGGPSSEPSAVTNNGIVSDKMVEMVRYTAKVEEASSSSPKLDSSVNHDLVQLSSTSTKQFTSPIDNENHREDKFEIDLMMPAPEKEEDMAEYGGEDEKCMVTEREMEAKTKTQEVEDDKAAENTCGGGGVECSRVSETCDEFKADASRPHHTTTMTMALSPPPQRINLDVKERDFDLKLDLEKTGININNLNFQQPKQQQPKVDSQSDKIGVQSSSVPVPAGWHGGLAPMGYVGPLQGVVSMDGATMASPPIQPPPHFLFSQPRPKRCATHCYIASSISSHQQMIKMNPFWPVAPVGPTPILGAKSYNLNMVPSTDLLPGRGSMVSSAQDTKGQPYPLFPGQPPPSTSKDKSPQASSILPDSAQKKQFLVQPGLPPGSATNLVHGPALFFPMGHQQALPSARPGIGKSPSMGSGAAATASTSSSAPMGAVVSNAPPVGPAMSFSYPNINGNETQFMAILGNGGAYPFPIPAHVGPAQPYRGPHPHAMSFLNGSFYSSPMLHPSQLQQAQPGGPVPSQSMQMQQQNHQIASMSTVSSSSQKQFQSQQQRHQLSGSGANNAGNQNQNSVLQNFQGTKGEDSPSSADSRNRPNMSLYAPNFPMPFHSPNFALIPSSFGSGATNAPGVSNGNNHSDKKQQQSQQAALNAPFPMSFTTINGANTPGLDISSMAHNHAFFQNLPDAAKQSYQMMAAAAAAQAAQQRMSSYRGPNDGKNVSAMATDPSNLDEERRAMAARVSPASVGQSIAFSRDSGENSVVDSSARSLNLAPGSTRPTRSSGPNNPANSSNSQQQQHQSQMLFPKQQQYTPATAGNARSKTPSTSNGNVYPDHLNSSPVMAAKIPNSLSGFPSLVQSTVGASTQSQWKNSARPNTSQMSSTSITTTTSNPSNLKNHPQQQGRPQQSQTQISFGSTVANSKPNPSSQAQQNQNSSLTSSSPMMVGSPSNSTMSKSAGGSPRTSASNKSAGQPPTLTSQQGKNSPSPSPSLSSQKPSILGAPHVTPTSSPSAGKPQLPQQPHQQSQLSKQSIQHAQQLYFSNYMQQAANTSGAMAGPGYYLQRHRPDNQQPQGSKPQGGSVPPTTSSGMLSLCTPVSFSSVTTLDPAKAVPGNIKGGLHSQVMFNAAAQSGGAARPYPNTVSTGAPVKPTEQKQTSGE